MEKSTMLRVGLTMKEAAEIISNTDLESVIIPTGKEGEENNKHIEVSFHYNKDRKKFYVSMHPMTYERKNGYVSRTYDIFSGTSGDLNDVPIGRKSPKAEKEARQKITENVLNNMMSKIKL